MTDVPDVRVLHGHDVAESCLLALVRLSKKLRVYWIGWIEDEVNILNYPAFFGREYLGEVLSWLLEQGLVEKLGRETYVLTYRGEIAHYLLAFENHALA